MTTREDIVSLVNGSQISAGFQGLQSAILGRVLNFLTLQSNREAQKAGSPQEMSDRMLLNAVGPAAAGCAIEYAISKTKSAGLLSNVSLNCDFVGNLRIIEECDHKETKSLFSQNLRSFLSPGFANIGFDSVVDPRHMVDSECGYPANISLLMYQYMYDRDDIARRVVDIYPDECWAVDPEVYDEIDEDKVSPLEKSWQDLCSDYNILQTLYRTDKGAGKGRYGAILIGIEGDSDLSVPINEEELLKAKKRARSKKERQLLYLRPFDEYHAFVKELDSNPNSPRFNQPETYSLAFVTTRNDTNGRATTSKVNQSVHWTRVVHCPTDDQEDLVYATPRLQPVFNRVLDLRKIKGASAEMFWKGGFQGLSFEIDPQYVADNPEFNSEEFKEQVRKFSEGLQRHLINVGISAKTLDVNIADPKSHVFIQMQAIAAHKGIPLRIFLGSEEGRLAASQDKVTWNQRLKRRIKNVAEPNLLRALVDRFIAIGVMPYPQNQGRYFTAWPDLNVPSDEDKANLSLKWTQALSQYVSSGVIHLIPPMDYLTTIMGLVPSQARKIVEKVKALGGWAKLLKVDPSQGSGVNGKSMTIAKKDSNKERGARKKRNTADKKTEGMKG